MRASSKRVLSILASAALFFASLVVYAVFIKAEYRRVDQLRAEVEARANLLTYQKEVVNQIKKLLSEYQSVARLEETISAALPKKANVSEAVWQFESLAKLAGLSVQSVTVSPLAIKPSAVKLSSAKGLGTLRFNVKVFGPYEGLKKFLEILETNIRVMDVASVKVESAEKNFLLYTLVVDVYYQSE